MPASVHRVKSGSGGTGGGGGGRATAATVQSTKSLSSENRPNVEAAKHSTATMTTIQTSTSTATTTIATPPATAVKTTVNSYSVKRKTALRQIATTLGAAWRPEATVSSVPSSTFSGGAQAAAATTAATAASSSPSFSSVTSTPRGRSSTRIRKPTQHFKPTTAPTFTRPWFANRDAAATTKVKRQRRLPKTRFSQPKTKISQLDQELHDAAHASRLHAHGLCQEEFDIFQNYLRRGDLPAYLAVRNTILWLWRTNPKQRLSYADAFVKTKDLGLHHGLIYPIYEFLVRSGYINFGLFREAAGEGSTHHDRHCLVEDTTASMTRTTKSAASTSTSRRPSQQKTIAIVGAGIAGIGCARQLNNLFETYRDRFLPEQPPKVVVLEARSRIGGRMHTVEIQTSHLDKVAKMDPSSNARLPPSSGQPVPVIVDPCPLDYKRSDFSHAVDLGAQIITGFDNGNPMEIIVRRQLTDLHLYYLGERPCDLFGPNGRPVDKLVDEQCEGIFNDVLEKACKLRHTQQWPRPLLDYLKKRHKQASAASATQPHQHSAAQSITSSQEHRHPRAEHAKQHSKTAETHPTTKTEADHLEASATLGVCMDYFVENHPDFGRWTDHELELIHWHYANLEFANATPLDKLSLKNWDQDDDFEFSGQHCMVAGGYGQVPLALSTGLDIRLDKPVAKVCTDDEAAEQESVHIQCRDGSIFDCTAAVITIPLGVLKRGGSSTSLEHGARGPTAMIKAASRQDDGIVFEPELPDWKRKAIDHLGFGLLNKLVLVFPEHFWDKAVELFGSVRGAATAAASPSFSSANQKSKTLRASSIAHTPYRREAYESSRGKFYMFWNCINVSGLPTLVTLMAGQAAYESEATEKEMLVQEALETLERIFPDVSPLPRPVYTIVTRWSADEFARGSYSFVGQDGTGHDYDLIARPVKNQLYFAGEATSRHYPATAHGAYLSGLKVASDILTSLIGPLTVEDCVAAAAKAEAEARRILNPIKTEDDDEGEENEGGQVKERQGQHMDLEYLPMGNVVSSASSPLRSFGDAHTEESPPPDHHRHFRKRRGSLSSLSSTEGNTNLGHGFVMPRRRWGRASKKMIARFVADRSHYKYKSGMLASASSSEDEDDIEMIKEEDQAKRNRRHPDSSTEANGAVEVGTKRRRRRSNSVSSLVDGVKKTRSLEPAHRRPGRPRGNKVNTRGAGRSVGRPKNRAAPV